VINQLTHHYVLLTPLVTSQCTQALVCYAECWDIFYPTRELQLRLLYSLLFATAAVGSASDTVREHILWATLTRLASRAGAFLRLFPDDSGSSTPSTSEQSAVVSVPVSGEEAFEAITVSSNTHMAANLADPSAAAYWESSGPSGTHWIVVEMQPDVYVEEMCVHTQGQDRYVDVVLSHLHALAHTRAHTHTHAHAHMCPFLVF
jgi:hypothetical protein